MSSYGFQRILSRHMEPVSSYGVLGDERASYVYNWYLCLPVDNEQLQIEQASSYGFPRIISSYI